MALTLGSEPCTDAPGYDRWFDTAWGRHAFRVERAALRRAIGPLNGKRVLDVGCGTGRFTADFETDARWVAAVDLDPTMVQVASTRVRGPLLVADAHQLPYCDAAFDVTVAVTLCEFTADPATVIGELARVTRPGGRIVIGTLNPRSPWATGPAGATSRTTMERGSIILQTRDARSRGAPWADFSCRCPVRFRSRPLYPSRRCHRISRTEAPSGHRCLSGSRYREGHIVRSTFVRNQEHLQYLRRSGRPVSPPS